MTDNTNTPEDTVTVADAMHAVDIAVTHAVNAMNGDPNISQDRDEVHRQHLAAIAMAERLAMGAHADVLALLPRTLNACHSQILACAAVLGHVAKFVAGDEYADLLDQARADLLAQEMGE